MSLFRLFPDDLLRLLLPRIEGPDAVRAEAR